MFELKDALLYFRHVVSLSYTVDILNECLRLQGSGDPISKAFESGATALGVFAELSRVELTPPELRRTDFYEAMAEIGEGHIAAIFSNYWRSEDPEHIDFLVNNLMGPAKALLKKFAITDLPLVLPPEFIDLFPKNSADVSVTLASMKLIDTARTPLSQIYEFRRDEEAARKLRRLRTFAYENYRDKPRTFVEDDLLTRISEYEDTVKKWGFETRSAVLTALLDSRLIAGGIAGSFLSSYFGSPLLGISTTLGATGLAIGKVAIELGRQQFNYRDLLANNPVSYIAYANDKIAR